MNTIQEPKYEAKNNRIYNRASGEVIPDDEPIFILRARDLYSQNAIQHYLEVISSGTDHEKAVENRLLDFQRFSKVHPERMKYPDTTILKQE